VLLTLLVSALTLNVYSPSDEPLRDLIWTTVDPGDAVTFGLRFMVRLDSPAAMPFIRT